MKQIVVLVFDQNEHRGYDTSLLKNQSYSRERNNNAHAVSKNK